MCRETRCYFHVRTVCHRIFGLHQGCQVPFQISRGNAGFLLRHCRGKRPHLAMMGEPRGFSRVAAGFSSYDGELREPLLLAQGSPISIRVTRGTWGLLSSHCRSNGPHLDLCPETLGSFPVATGILGLHSSFTWGVRPRLAGKERTTLSYRFVTGISWSPLSGLKEIKPPVEF